MHRNNTNKLGQLKIVDIFMTPIQAVKEMKKYQKINEVEVWSMQIEDLEGIEVNELEDIEENDDQSEEIVETKNDKDDRIKKLVCASYRSTWIFGSNFLRNTFENEKKIFVLL